MSWLEFAGASPVMRGQMKVGIHLRGCDDDTKFEMDVTEEGLELLREVEAKSKEVNTSYCMPELFVEVL